MEPTQEIQQTSPSQSKTQTLQTVQKEHNTPSTKDNNSQEQLVQLGPFVFYFSKLRVFMKHPELQHLEKQNQHLLKLLENGETDQKLLENLPHAWFQATFEYLGKNFKLTKPNDKSSTNLGFLLSFKNEMPMKICHIRFTNLITLNLSKQDICSIESLAFIDAPKLACLELYGNHIYSMQPLAKADFQKLRVITFYRNPIAKMENFYRINNDKLNKYEFGHAMRSPILMEDYRFLFKMQNRNFKELNVKDPNRINLKGRGIFNKLNQPETDIIFLELAPRVRRRLD